MDDFELLPAGLGIVNPGAGANRSSGADAAAETAGGVGFAPGDAGIAASAVICPACEVCCELQLTLPYQTFPEADGVAQAYQSASRFRAFYDSRIGQTPRRRDSPLYGSGVS